MHTVLRPRIDTDWQRRLSGFGISPYLQTAVCPFSLFTLYDTSWTRLHLTRVRRCSGLHCVCGSCMERSISTGYEPWKTPGQQLCRRGPPGANLKFARKRSLTRSDRREVVSHATGACIRRIGSISTKKKQIRCVGHFTRRLFACHAGTCFSSQSHLYKWCACSLLCSPPPTSYLCPR